MNTQEIQRKFVFLPGAGINFNVHPDAQRKYRVEQSWLNLGEDQTSQRKLVSKTELDYFGMSKEIKYYLVEKQNGLVSKNEISLEDYKAQLPNAVKTLRKYRKEFLLFGHACIFDLFLKIRSVSSDVPDPWWAYRNPDFTGEPVRCIIEFHFKSQDEANQFVLPESVADILIEDPTLSNKDLFQKPE